MFTEADRLWMRQALELAAQGLFTTTPNPRVGCVIVKDEQLVGEGWHRQAGQAHAEVIALGQAGGRAQGATAYVTLEPCSHFGRTPPCVNALVEARISRVVVAMEDPNPLVGGQGLAALRASGIEVRCGLLENEVRELNLGFVSRMVRGQPWVRLKTAASLDGRTALPDGRSQWITGDAARHDGHHWRARACAILTGIGTVRADNPRLNVRDVATSRQPRKVLIDSRLEVNPQAQLFEDAQVWVIAAVEDSQRIAALHERGAEVLVLPNAQGKTDLPAVMRELARRGINELHVEAGAQLNGSLLREDCVDEWLAYIAPVMLGEGPGVASLPVPASLAEAPRFVSQSVQRIGEDIRWIARHPQWSERIARAPSGAPSGESIHLIS
jgi:diaminohydroxyphosphoribosylaminopyrimidine deaminase / 5-amino-6-(5-phosphoribosylamino)uracil reductase